MIKLTYNEALEIQQEQLVWYENIHGKGSCDKIRRDTKPCPFNPNEPRPSWEINELVPRGSAIEQCLGIDYGGD